MAHLRGGIRIGSISGHERYKPNTEDMEWKEEQAGETYENVGYNERVLTGIVGGGLLLRSVVRPSSLASGIAALLGIALLHRAVSGYCAAYGAMGVNTHENNDTSSLGRQKVRTGRAVKVERSITIQRPAQDLYRFWRQLDNLPKVMSHVRSVQPINDHLSHWIVDTLPGAPTVEWDAEIINEVEHERIGWRTLHGAAVEHTGSVAFEPLGNGRSTRVTVTLQYDPPAGPIGAAVANLLGQDPGRKIRDDLERFKQTMEAEAHSSR